MKTFISILLIPFLLNFSFAQELSTDSLAVDTVTTVVDEVEDKSEQENNEPEKPTEYVPSYTDDADSGAKVERIELTQTERNNMNAPKRTNPAGRIILGVFIAIGVISVLMLVLVKIANEDSNEANSR